MKTCAAYIRVSTEDQVEYSPESQKEKLIEYAKRNDMILPEEFIYQDDGKSGRTVSKRRRFQDMIGRAKEKPCPFEVILVWKFSRFARNQEESILYKSMLKRECNIEVISVSEPLVEGPFGSLIERIIEWMDEYYSIRLAGEVKRGMTKRVSTGAPVTTAPFGYNMDDGKLVINQNEAELVKMIYSRYLAGESIMEIARQFNAMLIRTKRGKTTWENRTIRYILSNPVYIGKLRWSTGGKNDYHKSTGHNENTMLIDGQHEPIVDEESYNQVQKKLLNNVNTASKYQRHEQGKIPFILQGLVKCYHCGGTLTHTGTSPSALSLNCSKYVHGKCKKSCHVRESVMENLVFMTIQQQMKTLNFTVNNRSKEIAPKNDVINKQIEKEYNVLARIKEAYENGIDTLEEYRDNKIKCQERIATLQKQLVKQTPPVDKNKYAKKRLADMKKLLDPDITAKEKNIILKSFIEKIVYEKASESITIFYFN